MKTAISLVLKRSVIITAQIILLLTMIGTAEAAAQNDLSGEWESDDGAVLEIAQKGQHFVWSSSKNFTGTGTVSGIHVTFVYMSQAGEQVLHGVIVEFSPDGEPTRINLDNGRVLTRHQPPPGPEPHILDIAGHWNSNIGEVFTITQVNKHFEWENSKQESGIIYIHGINLEVSYGGQVIPGRIVEFAPSEFPIRILMDNGVELTRATLPGKQPPAQGGKINVIVTALPPIVGPSQKTVISVRAVSDQGNPIPGADVKLSAGGGVFDQSKDRFVSGKTDNAGFFETHWHCVKCGSSYGIDVEVTKPGYQTGTTQLTINIKSFEKLQPVGQKADLEVYQVKMDPASPKANQSFCLEIYITNSGDAASGKYGLWITIHELGSNIHHALWQYPTWPAKEGLQPGQIERVYYGCDVQVKNKGNYELSISMKPINNAWEDKNPENNDFKYQFMAQ